MRILVVTGCFVVLMTAVGAAAQEVDSTMLFPIVARTAGVGTSRWVTDLTVHNLRDQAVIVGVQFFPADQTNSLDFSFPDRVAVPPRETVVIEDVLATVFGYQSNIKGALLITVENDFIAGNPDDAEIVAVTRTFNAADPAGTYGQTVPALFAAATAMAGPVVATGARNDSRYRSNLGIVNMSVLNGATIHYRVLGRDATVLAEGTREMPALSVSQWSLQQLGVGSVDGPLTAELWIDPDDLSPDPCDDFATRLIGYFSKVDNGTGDAEFIYAAPTEKADCDD